MLALGFGGDALGALFFGEGLHLLRRGFLLELAGADDLDEGTGLRRLAERGHAGLALGVGARIGRVLRVAALELLARVDGGQMSELLLARDFVGRALDRCHVGSMAFNCAAFFYVLAALFSTSRLPLRYLATVNKLARLPIGS